MRSQSKKSALIQRRTSLPKLTKSWLDGEIIGCATEHRNGYSTLDADSDPLIPISLTISTKGATQSCKVRDRRGIEQIEPMNIRIRKEFLSESKKMLEFNRILRKLIDLQHLLEYSAKFREDFIKIGANFAKQR